MLRGACKLYGVCLAPSLTHSNELPVYVAGAAPGCIL